MAGQLRSKVGFVVSEASGALGDLGTLLPILVSLGRTGQISLTSSLVFGGAFNIITALLYNVPMCVQPMKAISASALASNLSQAEIVSAGMTVSAVVLFLGATGLINVVNKYIPLPLVRGIQLGAGLALFIKGAESVLKASPFYFGGYSWMDNYLVAMLSFMLVMVLYRSKVNPAALILFAIGIAFAAVRMTGTGLPLPKTGLVFPAPAAPSWSQFVSGMLNAGLGQLPLTLLNSVIAVSKLADDLYPTRNHPVASVTSVAVCVGLMNLTSAWFGCVPYCHGSGGLAAQYRFGARTGISITGLGIAKILFGLLFGSSLVLLFQTIPNSILGVMLVIAGLELSACVRDIGVNATPDERSDDYTIMLVTAGGILGFKNDGVGFLMGVAAFFLVRVSRALDNGEKVSLATFVCQDNTATAKSPSADTIVVV
ncbi:hypothetical protein BC831DRAFT_427002 [Entophlyctis helioformis]|nr:hypothetical protein BC831DRAFT_427002 [Entophlyctis helioformis]